MSKQFSEAELIEYSKQIFKDNPDMTRVYACHDGNFFRDRDKNHATNFARESQQELVLIESIGQQARIVTADAEDPQTRDVTALMLALDVTEDRARELIAEHRGNTAAAVQTARQGAPAEAAPATGRKSSTSKKTSA